MSADKMSAEGKGFERGFHGSVVVLLAFFSAFFCVSPACPMRTWGRAGKEGAPARPRVRNEAGGKDAEVSKVYHYSQVRIIDFPLSSG